MKWQILIPSVVIRDELLKRLIDRLQPQVAKYKGDIGVLIHWNNFEHQIGYVRQRLLEEASAEYVSFIDDDDLVPEDYCDSIYPLLDGVDYIGYKSAVFQNGRQMPWNVTHSLENSGWYEDGNDFYRRVVHTNPIKRELALKGRYDLGDYTKGIPEERVYADHLDDLVETEHYIDKVLHHYHQSNDTLFRRYTPASGNFKRPMLPKHFAYHTGSTHES